MSTPVIPPSRINLVRASLILRFQIPCGLNPAFQTKLRNEGVSLKEYGVYPNDHSTDILNYWVEIPYHQREQFIRSLEQFAQEQNTAYQTDFVF